LLTKECEEIDRETFDIRLRLRAGLRRMAGGNAQQSAVFAGNALGNAQGGARMTNFDWW
jgi:hypothetical protein